MGSGVDMKTKTLILVKTLYTLGLLLVATGLAFLMRLLGIGKESSIVVFLLAAFFTAILTNGYFYSMISSLAGVLLFNFFFTEPLNHFLFNSANDLILLAFFESVSFLAGTMASRLEKQKKISTENEQTAQLLSKISTGFLHVTGEKNILLQGISFVQQQTGLQCIIAMRKIGDPVSIDGTVPTNSPDKAYAIRGGSERIGTMKIYSKGEKISIQKEMILKSIATQIGMALDREFIYNERESIRLTMEGEKLRNALLRSIAHDLRSPLTSLSGASTLLADDNGNLTENEKKQLARDISEEMLWLTNLVENILNMTRISASQLVLHKEDEVVDDVVTEAVEHMKRLIKDRDFKVVLPDEVLTVPMDGKLIVQVLVNLLDNAIKHTSENDSISLLVTQEDNRIRFTVSDTGEGIDENIKDTLFESFVTSDRDVPDGKRGIGLGLAICKAIVKAHGGMIKVEPNQPKGSQFVFDLPRE